RLRLEPGESRRITLTFVVGDLAFWDVTRGRFVVEDAPHVLMVGRSARDIRLSAPLHVPGERIPPRDPSAGPVRAVDHDEYDGITLVDASRESGDAVRAREAGGWIRFQSVDFGAGASSCVITAGSTEGAVVTLRLDDPLFGKVAGTIPVPPVADKYETAEATCSLDGVAGLRDLYVVFENEGVTLTTIEVRRA